MKKKRTLWQLLLLQLAFKTLAFAQLMPAKPLDAATRKALLLLPEQQLTSVMAVLKSESSKPSADLYGPLSYIFVPTGYITVQTIEHTEVRLPVEIMLRRCRQFTGRSYSFVKGQWCHFKLAEQSEIGSSMQILTYSDVQQFSENRPVTTTKVSKVVTHVKREPPAPEYWQLFELVVRESESVP